MRSESDAVKLEVSRIKDWSGLRDVIAPALRRDYPGCIIEIDECVVTTDWPDPDAWRGARLTILGIEYRTAGFIIDAFPSNVNHGHSVRFQRTMLSDDEMDRWLEHLHSRRRAS